MKKLTVCPFCGYEKFNLRNEGYECPKCKNVWNENSAPSQKKHIKKCAIVATGTIGSTICANNVVKEAQAQDYDLLKTTTKDGAPTGHGNMHENVIRRENPGAKKVNNPGSSSNHLLKERDGADLKLKNGNNIQGKCCKTAERATDSLFRNGVYRYPGQMVYVPKGQRDTVKTLLKERGVDAEVKETNKTYEETKELCKAGRESIMFDASNPIVFKNAVLVGVIVGGCVYMYLKQCKPKKKKLLKAIGSGIVASIITIAGFVGYGQIKRL